jgi:hypothetical protein
MGLLLFWAKGVFGVRKLVALAATKGFIAEVPRQS